VKIFIDTNWFLAFYQSSDEPTAVLEELSKRAERIVLPEQTINEVRRNRGKLIAALRKNVAESIAIKPFTTSFLRSLPEFTRLLEARDALRSAGQATLNAIDAMNSSTDPVVSAFDSLVHGCTKIWTTPEIVTTAQRRKLCGQPPTTAGRDSIGDEINWESLLVGCHEDLVVITLDQDYLDHIDLLQREYLRRTSKLLLRVTRRLAPILEEFGDRSPAIEAAEKSIHAIYRCSNCGASDWHPEGERDEKYNAVLHRCGNCKVAGIYIT
jgi:predicted nucleic acid-binding protein/DNA-directed RNA polymerase subunit RPC12/RpoP